MEVVTVKLPMKRSIMVPDLKEVRIFPIGDLQYSSSLPDSDIDRLEKHIKWASSIGGSFIGMGDFTDVASPSNRKIISIAKAELYDSTRKMLDTAAEHEIDILSDLLKPTRGKWIGLLTGHHWWRFPDGSTTESRLAENLRTRELGTSALINIPMSANGAKATATIWAHHGTGGGITEASGFNRLAHMTKAFYAHAYLMGHVHKTGVMPIPFIDYRDGRDRSIKRFMVLTGGCLKGYIVGRRDEFGHPHGSYVEEKMLPPTALGFPVLTFKPRKRNGIANVDTNAWIA